MGGYTKIELNSKGIKNVDKINEYLDELKCNKLFRFDTLADMRKYYKEYKDGLGAYNWGDENRKFTFAKYLKLCKAYSWYEKPFVLEFDCYFGRTNKSNLRKLGKVIAKFADCISYMGGSSETFMERSMTKREQTIILSKKIKGIEYPVTSTVYSIY